MKILHFPFQSLDSTNLYAKTHFNELPDAALVTAETQTAGRGRIRRVWFSPPGNLYASFVMKDVKTPGRATIAASLAVLATLRTFDPHTAYYIKWPNDVYAGCLKVAGLLSECVVENGRAGGVIAGMGVNINMTKEDLERTGGAASSLFVLSGTQIPLQKVISELEKNLLECYIIYSEKPDLLFQRWKAENRLIGKTLEFLLPDNSVLKGVLKDLTRDGEAVVSDGTTERIVGCGDVSLRKTNLNLI